MAYKIFPVHSIDDSGKNKSAELPKAKSADNGKVLSVKNGKWVAAKQSKVAASGDYEDLKNKPNLNEYAKESELEELQEAVESLVGFSAEVVDELPAEGENGVIYLVPSDGGNECAEYLYVNGAWEKIGTTAIDPEEIDSRISALEDAVEAIEVPVNISELNNDAGYITENDLPDVPANLSELNNDVGFITENDLPDIPSNISELNNDAGFITENDLPEIPENVSAFNNDAGYLSDVPVVNNIIVSQNDYRPAHVASVNGHNIDLPGHTLTEVAQVRDQDTNIDYASKIKTMSSQVSGDDSNSFYIPIYSEEIISSKQITTKEYVDGAINNAINNIPEVSYDSIKNRPTKVSEFDNDANYVPREQYNKLLKALDTLVADQGKGARSAEGELFETAMDAIDTAEPGVPMEVALTADEENGAAFLLMGAEGDVDKDITFDLNGHNYLATQAGGSAGTQTQAVHLEKDNTVVIKGGSLEAALDNPQIKMLIQNYSNLTLEDMVIDCSNNPNIQYVVSNNFGSCLIKNCTITAPSTGVAVDCWFGLLSNGLYDDGLSVTIEDSVINGNIEYGAQRQSLNRPGNEEWWEKAQLTIINSIVNGQIVNSGAGANDQHHIVIDGVRYEGELPVQFNLM